MNGGHSIIEKRLILTFAMVLHGIWNSSSEEALGRWILDLDLFLKKKNKLLTAIGIVTRNKDEKKRGFHTIDSRRPPWSSLGTVEEVIGIGQQKGLDLFFTWAGNWQTTPKAHLYDMQTRKAHAPVTIDSLGFESTPIPSPYKTMDIKN
jgi:hypothetical protein